MTDFTVLCSRPQVDLNAVNCAQSFLWLFVLAAVFDVLIMAALRPPLGEDVMS